MRTFWRIVNWGAAAFVVLFVVSGFGAGFLFEIPFTLVFGWIKFLRDNLAVMEANPFLLAEAAACVAALGAGGHWFARWLYREMTPGAPGSWRPGWTIAGLAGVLLLFVAGIATIGITHQAAWLFTAKGPLLEDSFGARARVSEVLLSTTDARVAVAETFAKTGKLPASNAEAGLAAATEPRRYVKSISIASGGVVNIEVPEAIAGGGTITFTPTPSGETLGWTCSSTLPQRVLPATCRQPSQP